MLMMIGLVAFVYKSSQIVATKAPEEKIVMATTTPNPLAVEITEETPWEVIYPNTKTMTIGEVEVKASVAKTWPERIKGLSDTPYLPDDVVKLFNFDSAGFHSIWMKDMNYSIDIIWVDSELRIVHIVEKASPESYPAMFVTEVPAVYVIETVAGFVAENGIVVGDSVVLPIL